MGCFYQLMVCSHGYGKQIYKHTYIHRETFRKTILTNQACAHCRPGLIIKALKMGKFRVGWACNKQSRANLRAINIHLQGALYCKKKVTVASTSTKFAPFSNSFRGPFNTKNRIPQLIKAREYYSHISVDTIDVNGNNIWSPSHTKLNRSVMRNQWLLPADGISHSFTSLHLRHSTLLGNRNVMDDKPCDE